MPRQLILPADGELFGVLRVRAGCDIKKEGRRYVFCVCACGQSKYVKPSDLRRGAVSSCGCIPRAILLDRNQRLATHRMSGAPEHHIWRGILDRCLNQNSKYYARYGGRGVGVCDRWRDSFSSFLADMGPRPSNAFTVERKDNSKGYAPENCIWATRKEQNRNKRSNRLIDFNGARLPVSEVAEAIGIKPGTLFARLNRGMTPPRLYQRSGLMRGGR